MVTGSSEQAQPKLTALTELNTGSDIKTDPLTMHFI